QLRLHASHGRRVGAGTQVRENAEGASPSVQPTRPPQLKSSSLAGGTLLLHRLRHRHDAPATRNRQRQRPALLRSRLLAVAGQWQARDGSTHLIARRLVDMTPWLGELATRSRDFH
ncbi:MAG: hypothetical protein Q8L49_11840, partial [Burkholderiaceae bacterium]|nr:hypothetical protein [Burkholderiaceae bacterium]